MFTCALAMPQTIIIYEYHSSLIPISRHHSIPCKNQKKESKSVSTRTPLKPPQHSNPPLAKPPCRTRQHAVTPLQRLAQRRENSSRQLQFLEGQRRQLPAVRVEDGGDIGDFLEKDFHGAVGCDSMHPGDGGGVQRGVEDPYLVVGWGRR